MKLRHLYALVFLFCILVQGHSQRNCGSHDHLLHQLETNPDHAKNLEAIEKHTAQWIANHADQIKAGELLTIPVVFHVVYNNASENISDAQILSQLTVLNDDFRRLNTDQTNDWPQAADTELEFCLATVDPNGASTTGITRTSTSVTSFGTNDAMKFDAQGGKDAWPAADYLNFWVCDISGGI